MSRNSVISILFIIFITGMSFLHLMTDDRSFSAHENRLLTTFPTLSLDNILSGEYMEQLETYFADQFVAKNFWLGMKANTEQALGKQENNGIYFGNNDWLFEPFVESKNQLLNNIKYLNELSSQLIGVDTYLMLVPTAVEMYPEYVPPFAPTDDQKQVIDLATTNLNHSITFIDVYNRLINHKDEYIYFKTDHHWTMLGAYYAYEEASEAMSYDALPKDRFHIQTISQDFYGTHYSKANKLTISPDEIQLLKPKEKVSVEVTYDNDEKKDDMYVWDALNKRDQYRFFLDGNHQLIKIKTGQNNDKRLTVIKDSYAHIFIPLMANHYEEIHIIDLRYFRESIKEYITHNKSSEVLFLYNVVTFSEDNNFVWLKK